MRFAPRQSWIALSALLAGCTTGATQVIVTVASDAPADRPLIVRVTVRAGTSAIPAGARPDHEWTRGAGTGSLVLPASFTIVPGNGAPRDQQVTMLLEAVSGESVIRRLARFRFVPHQTGTLGIFLATGCTATDTRCAHSNPCEVQSFCEEQGQTCGDNASCVPIDVTPAILADAGGDSMTPRDASADTPSTCTVNCNGGTGHFTNIGPRNDPDSTRQLVDEELSGGAAQCSGTRCISGGIAP